MNGTAVYGEKVVIVEVYSGHVKLRTGRVSSTESSHVQADNHNQTVIRGDKRFRPVTFSREEAFEQSFKVDDVHLLKEQDVQSLQNPDKAQDWFGSIYQDKTVGKIQRALKRLKK